MESKIQGLIFIGLAIVVAGCSGLSGGGNTDSSQPKMVSGKGLEVTQFRVSDQTLTPRQTVQLSMELKNYHRNNIELQKPTLYNLGLLEKSEGTCTPEPSKLKSAHTTGEGKPIYPVMECSWEITAPSSEMVGGFKQRKSSITANIAYNSSIENFQPMKVQFKPLSEINRTGKKAMTFSNGEMKVSMNTESPVALGQNKTVGFKVTKVGSGRIEGGFDFEYEPSNVFIQASDYGDSSKADVSGECPKTDKMVLKNRLEFNCNINAEGTQEVVRNLFFTVRYKYIQAPSLDITIVKQ